MSEAGDTFGSLATAGLIGQEIERARGGQPAVGHHIDEPCSNCGTRRLGPYCHECGQAGHVHRTLGALVHDISHGVFHFEGKIWKTLPMLAWRPGELTRRYVHGERAKFVSPMALFLFSVFLMFAVVSNVGHHSTAAQPVIENSNSATIEAEKTKLETKIAAYKTARATVPAGSDGQKAMDAKIAAAEESLRALKLSGRVAAIMHHDDGDKGQIDDRDALKKNGFNTGFGWLDRLVSHTARNPELTAYKLKTYGYKYSWALIPISLPFLWLLFCFRRDVGLYDHAIFAIYSISFMSLGVVALVVAGVIGVPAAIIVLTAIFVPPIHMYRQLKGAYLLGRFGALWRTSALLIVTLITLSLFLSFIIWMGSD